MLKRFFVGCASLSLFFLSSSAFAGEANIQIPDLTLANFVIFGKNVTGLSLMYWGLVVCVIGVIFGFVKYMKTKALPVHSSMEEVSNTIWETCKTYLIQQGKFLGLLWLLVAACIAYYFYSLQHSSVSSTLVILASSILGIAGSYGVAWFGIRINTRANSRTAFAALAKNPMEVFTIPLQSGMSVGLLLVSVELFFMICILTLLPSDLAGPCFIGFAIGESLGASVLRICGGIFTKIADIGSDLMKIVFHLPEDDPKNPGVIADCTGDNAGDSVGPTADGFETYGVTGVALIAFLALVLVLKPEVCGHLIIWIFAMRILMVLTSLISYYVNQKISNDVYGEKKDFNLEAPLTHLVWITSGVSIAVTFGASYLLLASYGSLWWVLSAIISCGTAAGALIPEFTKVFTSTHSAHVKEVVNASRQGGASLNILSGLVAGNFSAFWQGFLILILMFIASMFSQNESLMSLMPSEYPFAAPIFAFGLVAFGFLGMGPVTIAVDSFGPVTDNDQSVYELSLIEKRPQIKEEIRKQFGFEPNFAHAKHILEKGDGAGNTFKATAKPMLIGTAVVGATTMVFGIILLLEHMFGNVVVRLSLVQPEVMLGLLMGGAVVYWFTGASMQAVVTGAYRAVVYIKENIKLDGHHSASIEDSKKVV